MATHPDPAMTFLKPFSTPRWLRRLWIVFVLLSVLAWGFLAFYNGQRTYAQEATHLRLLSASLARMTALTLGGLRDSFALIAQEIAHGREHGAPNQPMQPNAILQTQPTLGYLAVVSASGRIVAAAGRGDWLPQGPSAARLRREVGICLAQKTFYIGSPISGTVPKSWAVPLCHPVPAVDGGGAILALLPLEDGIFPSWKGLPLPPHTALFLLRDDGYLESRFPSPTLTAFDQRQAGIAARYLQAHPGLSSGIYTGISKAVGEWRMGAVQRVAGYPLVAGASTPRATLWALWTRGMLEPTAGIAFLLFFSFFGYRFLLREAKDREFAQQQARQEIWEAKEQAEVTLASIGDAVITTDASGRVTGLNPVAESMLGYRLPEVQGRDLEEIFPIRNEQTRAPASNPVRRVLQEGRVVGLANHTILVSRDGREYAIEDSAAPIRRANGEILGVILVFHDVTEKRGLMADLAHQATHDVLTGLPNRTLFMDRLGQFRSQSHRHEERLLAVGILDLDGFKQVNDRLGHDHGDQLLQEVARRMCDTLRVGDTVGRMGGDEFGILLPDVTDLEQVEGISRRLLEALRLPVTIMENTAVISGSLGWTVYPQDEGNPQTLLRHADLALYAAKDGGRNRYAFFAGSMDEQQRQEMEMYAMTESALAERRLILFYQPVVELHNGVIGVEALIRMEHPERGILPPAAFASSLDHPRLARRIGCLVLDLALAQGAIWHRQGLTLRIAVNISTRHLLDDAFLSDLQEALARYPDMPHKALEVEVTESAPMLDFRRARETLLACNQLGVRVALDDFGTGSASLTYLQKLPAQTIKVDQSFVRDIINDPRDFAIVAGVVTTARMLGLEVIAEGVETIEHARLLTTLECHSLQGYAIAKPMPASAFGGWLNDYKSLVKEGNHTSLPFHDFWEDVTSGGFFTAHNLRIRQFLAALGGKAEFPACVFEPGAESHCHLGVWLQHYKQKVQIPASIHTHHHRLHALARTAKAQFDAGNMDAARQTGVQLAQENEALMQALSQWEDRKQPSSPPMPTDR